MSTVADTRLVVVIPVGPGLDERFVADTLDSVDRWCPGRRLIVVDDSGEGLGARLGASRGATVLTTRNGTLGGIYLSMSRAFEVALDEDFDVLLKLDTDALVLGGSFARIAAEWFREHPTVGCLGNHRLTYHGTPRSLRPAASRLMHVMTSEALPHPRRALVAAMLVGRAKRHGYVLGDHVLAGVCLYSRAAIAALHQHRLLGRHSLAHLGIDEDPVFGLALASVGLGLSQFGLQTDTLPVGAQWQGLPDSPEALVAAGKQLVHSTRSWDGADEAEVRRRFARAQGL